MQFIHRYLSHSRALACCARASVRALARACMRTCERCTGTRSDTADDSADLHQEVRERPLLLHRVWPIRTSASDCQPHWKWP